MLNWFEHWFDDNYLKLYHHRDTKDAEKQVKLIINTLKPLKSHSILDLACGEGRHCMLFQKRGFRITGIDLSKNLIKSGRIKYPELDLRVGDMRHIKGAYDIILSLFTSFGYFEKDRDNSAVFHSISHALNPGGWFWIDYLNPGYVKETLVPENTLELKDGVIVDEKRCIDHNTIVKIITFHEPGGEKKYQERVKLYTKDNLGMMMSRSCIQPGGAFGDYNGNPWSPGSPRTILYGRKISG
jgi:SAM-dependent methyltransferase